MYIANIKKKYIINVKTKDLIYKANKIQKCHNLINQKNNTPLTDHFKCFL